LRYDVTIIGGGIIGLATAMILAQRYDARLLLIEAEGELATHQTGHNSGVIHSGLYYRPGSLKARNCVTGAAALYDFCEAGGIPAERCGKVVVAVREEELPALAELQRRGTANGIEGIRRLNREELREQEPHLEGIAGLQVPATGIVDFRRVAQAYAETATAAGLAIQLHTRLTGVVKSGSELILETTRDTLRTGNLINCGGLQSDRIARICGLKPGVRIVPFRGEYYQLLPARQHLVRNLIYPVPDPRFPFLGVHFTRMIDGNREAGPNAVLAWKREGYSRLSFSLRDSWAILSTPAFWRMAFKYARVGLVEQHRSWNKAAFVKALQRLLPAIQPEDLAPGNTGVRAQALDLKGGLLDDFHLLEKERMLHVLNAPSPAATASLSIGAELAARAGRNFGLRERS